MQIALVLVRLGALTHKGEIETTTNCGLGIDLVVSQIESTFFDNKNLYESWGWFAGKYLTCWFCLAAKYLYLTQC